MVGELEAQCARLAAHIDAHEWSQLEQLLHDMGRTRHELINAWESVQAARTAEFDKEVALRVRRVLEYRAWQLNRLRDFSSEVSGRLALISKWNSYAKSAVGKRANAAALFNDIR